MHFVCLWSTLNDNWTPMSPLPYSSVQFNWCSNVGWFFLFFPMKTLDFLEFFRNTFSALFPCVRICMPLVNNPHRQLDTDILCALELYYVCAFFVSSFLFFIRDLLTFVLSTYLSFGTPVFHLRGPWTPFYKILESTLKLLLFSLNKICHYILCLVRSV